MVVVGLFLIIFISNTAFIILHGYMISKVAYIYFNIGRIGTGRGYKFLANQLLPALLLVNAGVILYIFIYLLCKERFDDKYEEYNYSQKFKDMEETAYKAMKLCGWFIYINFSAILSLAILTLGVDLQ